MKISTTRSVPKTEKGLLKPTPSTRATANSRMFSDTYSPTAGLASPGGLLLLAGSAMGGAFAGYFAGSNAGLPAAIAGGLVGAGIGGGVGASGQWFLGKRLSDKASSQVNKALVVGGALAGTAVGAAIQSGPLGIGLGVAAGVVALAGASFLAQPS